MGASRKVTAFPFFIRSGFGGIFGSPGPEAIDIHLQPDKTLKQSPARAFVNGGHTFSRFEIRDTGNLPFDQHLPETFFKDSHCLAIYRGNRFPAAHPGHFRLCRPEDLLYLGSADRGGNQIPFWSVSRYRTGGGGYTFPLAQSITRASMDLSGKDRLEINPVTCLSTSVVNLLRLFPRRDLTGKRHSGFADVHDRPPFPWLYSTAIS